MVYKQGEKNLFFRAHSLMVERRTDNPKAVGSSPAVLI